MQITFTDCIVHFFSAPLCLSHYILVSQQMAIFTSSQLQPVRCCFLSPFFVI